MRGVAVYGLRRGRRAGGRAKGRFLFLAAIACTLAAAAARSNSRFAFVFSVQQPRVFQRSSAHQPAAVPRRQRQRWRSQPALARLPKHSLRAHDTFADWSIFENQAKVAEQAISFGFGQEPRWLEVAFFLLMCLSYFPGPWQRVLDPIVSLINIFYLAKFSVVAFIIAGGVGYLLWTEVTTVEGMCPSCGALQPGSTVEPFQCVECGQHLEAEGEAFALYRKSGAVQESGIDWFRTLRDDVALAAQAWLTEVTSATAAEELRAGVVLEAEVL